MCFRGCDASYLEGREPNLTDAFALEDVETACKIMDINTILEESCEKGSVFMIKAIESKKPNWNWGLEGACRGGHCELAEWMVEKGATWWDWGLSGACRGGHRELAEFMIAKGATSWGWGLEGACIGGHRDMAEFMIEKGATNWNLGLEGAWHGGHRKLAEFMIEKGATKSDVFHRQFQ